MGQVIKPILQPYKFLILPQKGYSTAVILPKLNSIYHQKLWLTLIIFLYAIWPIIKYLKPLNTWKMNGRLNTTFYLRVLIEIFFLELRKFLGWFLCQQITQRIYEITDQFSPCQNNQKYTSDISSTESWIT